MSYEFCKESGIRIIDGDKITNTELNENGYFLLSHLKEKTGLQNKEIYEIFDNHQRRVIYEGKSYPSPNNGLVARRSSGPYYNFQSFYNKDCLDLLLDHKKNLSSNIHKPTPSPSNDFIELPRFVTLFDTETTGFSNNDAIVSFAYIHLDLEKREFVKAEEIFCDPEFSYHQLMKYQHSKAFEITGIKIPGMKGFLPSNEYVKPKVLSDKMVNAFSEYKTIMAHNMSFDKRMVNNVITRYNYPTLEEQGFSLHCSMVAAKKLLNATGSGQSKLDTLCDRFNIDRSKRVLHGALLDIELMSEVLYKFIDNGLLFIKENEHHIPKYDHSIQLGR